MLIVDGVEYYSQFEVAKKIERSYSGIKTWYDAIEFARENNADPKNEYIEVVLPELPTPRRDLDDRTTRYWTNEQIEQLIIFRDSIKRGDLAFYNRQKMWGERGARIQDKIDFKQLVEQETGEDINKLLEELNETK